MTNVTVSEDVTNVTVTQQPPINVEVSTAGIQGAIGPSNVLTVGTVSTLAPNATPTVGITGVSPAQIINFGIPAGAQILQGTATPTGALGQVGFWFINTTTWDVYEKTATSTWTSRGNIKGATGNTGPAPNLTIGTVANATPGTNGTVNITGTNPNYALNFTIPIANWAIGSTTSLIPGSAATVTIGGTALNPTLSIGVPSGSAFLNGTTAPASGTGKQGDWFLNNTTWDIYEKTSSTVWTLRGNIKGAKGDTGNTGPANVLSIGTVTTGAAGSNAAASITGTSPTQTLNLTLPTGATGPTGPAPNMAIGTVSGLAAGAAPTATITGTNPNYSLNLGIPKGDKGDIGAQWYTGSAAPTGATGVVGDFYLVTGATGTGDVYKKTGASTWTNQGNIRGQAGTGDVNSVNSVLPDGAGNVVLTWSNFSGTIPASALPSLATTETYTAASEAAMLALSAQRGDLAIRTDIEETFMLSGDDPTILANWTQLLTDGSTVKLTGNQTIAGIKTFSGEARVDAGAGYSLRLIPNNIQFNRAGASYIEQAVVGGNLTFRLSQTASLDTTILTLTTTSGGTATVSGVLNATSQVQESGQRVYSPNNIPSISVFTTGTLSDSLLPARLGKTSNYPTSDWNSAIDNGWYYAAAGSPNAPEPSTGYSGRVDATNTGNYLVQTAWPTNVGPSDTKTYMRTRTAGTWGSWFKLSLSQAEQDARFAPISHNHSASQITSGVLDIARIPTGTTGTTVALGNHLHTGVYEPVIAAGTTAQYRRGDNTWQNISDSMVDLTSAQTINGAKTFSTLPNAAVTTGRINNASLTGLDRQTWYDWARFRTPTSIETSGDGTTWTSITTANGLFAGLNSTQHTFTDTAPWLRVTWNASSYNQVQMLKAAFAYNGASNTNIQVTFETFDGTTWNQIHQYTWSNVNYGVYTGPLSDPGAAGSMRVTMQAISASTGTLAAMLSLETHTPRSDYGAGNQYNYPYTWDASANITPRSNFIINNGKDIQLFNTGGDRTTNYERARMYWSGNIFNLAVENGGTGVRREFVITGAYGNISFGPSAATAIRAVNTSATPTSVGFEIVGTYNAASGVQTGLLVDPTINQSGTAGYTGIKVNVTETATGSGQKFLMDLGVGGVTRAYVDNTGAYGTALASATSPAYAAKVSGDTVVRYAVYADGKIEWGPGSTSRDTNLYRSAADTLKTDDNFVVTGTIFASNGINVTGGQWINLGSSGYAPPSFGTRSAGTKIILWSNIGSSSTDNAIGMDANTIWFGATNASHSFKWYGGTTLAATLTCAGNLTTTGSVTATSFSGSGASLTSLNGSNISSGTVATARLGSGTADATTFLRGDNTWAAVDTSVDGGTV